MEFPPEAPLNDIERFLQQLTPQQETVKLLKEIRDDLRNFGQAFLRMHEDATQSRVPLEEVMTNITPQETPLMSQARKKGPK